MKKLTPPRIDDFGYLRILARNTKLSKTSYPHLQRQLRLIEDSYNHYDAVSGNAWLINKPAVTNELKNGIKAHYNSPPRELDYLARLRKSSPDICPMCGAFKPFTLDHILPQNDYQSWAIYSKNLVPACDCNNKRGTALKGDPVLKARVLHPYFDDLMLDRQLTCSIVGRKNFRWLDVKVDYVNPTHPDIASIKYHTQKIVIPSGLENWLRGQISKLKVRPSNVIQTLPRNSTVTEMQVEECIRDCLERNDERTGTPNNWESILMHGLLHSQGLLTFTTECNNKFVLDGETG